VAGVEVHHAGAGGGAGVGAAGQCRGVTRHQGRTRRTCECAQFGHRSADDRVSGAVALAQVAVDAARVRGGGVSEVAVWIAWAPRALAC
jgi:hypothetical protein